MFEKILVGVDGTGRGRDALVLGTALATATGAELVIAYVYVRDAIDRPAGPAARAAVDEAAHRLLDAEAELAPAGTRTVLAAGEPVARTLHRLAEHEQAGLLVIGSSRHGAVGRVLLGDVSRAIVRGAPCAVAVAPRDHSEVPRPIRTVGVGIDGSPMSGPALGAARELARRAGGGLRITVAIGPPLPPATPYPYGYLSAWEEHLEKATSQAQQLLDVAIAGSDVPAEGAVVAQSPATALPALSRECDVVLVGARRREGLRGLLLGSAGTALLRSAHCPVIVVPSGAGAWQPSSPAGDTAARP